MSRSTISETILLEVPELESKPKIKSTCMGRIYRRRKWSEHFRCNICNMPFMNKGNLSNHVKWNHNLH